MRYDAPTVHGFDTSIFEKPDAADPFRDRPNDVTAAYFLLIRYRLLTAAAFICPSTDRVPDTFGGFPLNQRSNFSDRAKGSTLSYSFICPYPDRGPDRYFVLPPKGDKELVIGADRNDPRERYRRLKPEHATAADLRLMNGQNHDGKGQNVLYNAGHVRWQETPFCGVRRDNIYTRHGDSPRPEVTNQPQHKDDTVLTPWYENGKLENRG